MFKKIGIFILIFSSFQYLKSADQGQEPVRLYSHEHVDSVVEKLDRVRSFFQQARATVQEAVSVNELGQLNGRYADLSLDTIRSDMSRDLSEKLARCTTNLATVIDFFASPSFATPEAALIRSEMEVLREAFAPLQPLIDAGDFGEVSSQMDVINNRFIAWWLRLKYLNDFDLPAHCTRETYIDRDDMQLAVGTRNELSWQQYLTDIRNQNRELLGQQDDRANDEVGLELEDFMAMRVRNDRSLLAIPSEYRTESCPRGAWRKVKAYSLLQCSRLFSYSGAKLINFSALINRYKAIEVEQILRTIVSPPIPIPSGVSLVTGIFERIVRDSVGEPGPRREISRTILEWAVHFKVVTDLSVATIQANLQANPHMSYAEYLRLVEEYIQDAELEWFINKVFLPSVRLVRRSVVLCGWNGITARFQNFVGTKLLENAESALDRSKELYAEDEAFVSLQRHRNCKMLLFLNGIRRSEKYLELPPVRTVDTILDTYLRQQPIQLNEAEDQLHDLAVAAVGTPSWLSRGMSVTGGVISSLLIGLAGLSVNDAGDGNNDDHDYPFMFGSMVFDDN